MRLPFFLGSAALLISSTAHAETYVAFDVDAAYRSGPIHWKSPPAVVLNNDTTPFEIDTHVYGPGFLSHVAVGGTLVDRWALAAEGGIGGYVVGSGFSWSGPDMILLARLGARVERSLGAGFVRGTLGYEWMAFPGGGVSIGTRDNVWQPEATAGPYASASGGVRGSHVGVVGRLDVGRATSTHAVYWPITVGLGIDFAWR